MEAWVRKRGVWLYLAAYGAVNLAFLTWFPLMHSDESWLSGLTRAMLEGGAAVSEPFFDLWPSYPNAMGSVFNLLQAAFFTVFGYGLFAARLLSLTFACAALFSFYRLLEHLTGSPLRALAFTAALSLDIQFLTAAHLARQDMIITWGAVTAAGLLLRRAKHWSFRRDALLGVLLGLLLGVHPNAVMPIACSGALYLYYILVKRSLSLRNLALLAGVTACFGLLYVGASLRIDPAFIRHYLDYGATLGTGASLGGKLGGLPNYFLKLWHRISGTYYIPPVAPQLALFGAAGALGALRSVRRREALLRLLPGLSVLAAVAVLGRYSQPAVVILFPLCYLTVFSLLDLLPGRRRKAAALALCAALAVQSAAEILPYYSRRGDYAAYLSALEEWVPLESGQRVLANLNAEYAFPSGALLDYRNLAYLGDMSFADYVRGRGVAYIVYPEELDYIYQQRPIWNILYGNLYPYYEDMQTFLNASCTLLAQFDSPYAMRISGYAYAQDWQVRIYRVEEARP